MGALSREEGEFALRKRKWRVKLRILPEIPSEFPQIKPLTRPGSYSII
jgi:hypothetical protein